MKTGMLAVYKSPVRRSFCRAQLCTRARLSYMRRVCLSVCPSHAGNASKLMNIGSCAFYHQIVQRPTFILQVTTQSYHKIITLTNLKTCCGKPHHRKKTHDSTRQCLLRTRTNDDALLLAADQTPLMLSAIC